MFDFSTAETNKNNFKETIKPGIHNVKITSLTNGLSAQKQSPYIEFTVETADNSELKHQYYLSTVINPGKTMSAWDASKNSILSITSASLSLDEASAKSKMPPANSVEELAQKLAILLVGKEFRLKVNGEEKISGKGNLYVASSFANGVFCESSKVAETKLKFDETKNIKRLPAGMVKSDTTTAQAAFSSPSADTVTF